MLVDECGGIDEPITNIVDPPIIKLVTKSSPHRWTLSFRTGRGWLVMLYLETIF